MFCITLWKGQSEDEMASACYDCVNSNNVPVIVSLPTLVVFERFEHESRVAKFYHPSKLGRFIANSMDQFPHYTSASVIFDAISGMSCVIFSTTGDVKLPDILTMKPIGNA